jgi:hypothetical protein
MSSHKPFCLIIGSNHRLEVNTKSVKTTLEAEAKKLGLVTGYIDFNSWPTQIKDLNLSQRNELALYRRWCEINVVTHLWVIGKELTMYHTILVQAAIPSQCIITCFSYSTARSALWLQRVAENCRRLHQSCEINIIGNVIPLHNHS